MLGIDLMGPLLRSPHKYEYLVVVVDYFTREVEFTQFRTAIAQVVLVRFSPGGVCPDKFCLIKGVSLYLRYFESSVNNGLSPQNSLQPITQKLI